MPNEVFTCVTCNVAFNDPELQRGHYKTDWHRYNLKRRVADLPAISSSEFNQRVQAQNTQLESLKTKENEEMFCKLCSKHYTTANAFANHKQSKKHLAQEAAILVTPTEAETTSEPIAVKSDRPAKKAAQHLQMVQKELEAQAEEQMFANPQTIAEGDEKEWEDVAEEDEDEFDESNGIDVKNCFFCEHVAASVEDKCEHMAQVHSFFIPDMEHVSDLEGLVKFLGVKLGAYNVCLWCSNKCYSNLLSVQRHMLDKGHQKMRFEGETLVEYAEFYNYEGDEADYDMLNESDLNLTASMTSALSTIEEGRAEASVFENENYQLVLPSGVTIGHRSLFRYYKQSFGHRCLELKKANNITMKDKYKAISCGGVAYSPTEIAKQRKDMAYFQRWSAKMGSRLGWKANKLQVHYRRQNITF